MGLHTGSPAASNTARIAFIAGALTASTIFFLSLSFVAYRIGYPALKEYLYIRVIRPSDEILHLPDGILKELIALNAVVDNAGNPTEALSHYTILVNSDQDVGWALIPNARISLYVLRALNEFNFDPPVLALQSDARISENLRDYINQQARLHYTYTVGADGFRRTIPAVDSERKILMAGDSVLFGEGVNDDSTMASYLQGMVGKSFRVVNAGVGGFSGEQALQMAMKAARKHKYDALIYVANQRDFMLHEGVAYRTQMREFLKKFAAAKETFSGKVIVILLPYMEYSIDDVLQRSGWYREMVAETDRLRKEMPFAAKDYGLEFIDGTVIVEDYARQSRTIMARFALYVDNAHLSPFGNRLVAEKLYESLRKIALIR
ncbi:MAG TPA: SGNH/GDSL hydrolase family protein [Candidatus Binatia bacterium]|nr:SGNH/GDSL hydrolase family protein [Candidatus Binatia bacterium]